jgi:hypothetical protein
MPHDCKGRPVKEGDIVLIKAVVKAVFTGEFACNFNCAVIDQTHETSDEYKPEITFNSRLVEVQVEAS